MAIARDDEGRLVMVKHARAGPGADRLRHEAAALEAAAGAGCVALAELAEEADGGVRLVTAWVGGGSLTAALPPGPARVRTLATGLAESLAELHRRGLVHGAVAPEHVLLDGDRPVLCGLGGARLPEDDDGGPTADDDVAALLALVGALVGDARGALPDQLRAVVAAGGAGGAAAVADRLATLAPDPPLPRRELRPRRPAPGRRRPPVGGLVVTGAAAAVLLALALATWRSGDGSTDPALRSTTTMPPCPSPAAPAPSADIDGDGCPEPVEVAGGVITVGDERWQVGEADDLVVVGDWDCDARATAAVVRPATGEVWVYDAWASASRPVTAQAGPDAAGATGARAVPGGGCARLEITTAAGDRERLTVDPP